MNLSLKDTHSKHKSLVLVGSIPTIIYKSNFIDNSYEIDVARILIFGVFVYRLVWEIVDLLGAVQLRYTPPFKDVYSKIINVSTFGYIVQLVEHLLKYRGDFGSSPSKKIRLDFLILNGELAQRRLHHICNVAFTHRFESDILHQYFRE